MKFYFIQTVCQQAMVSFILFLMAQVHFIGFSFRIMVSFDMHIILSENRQKINSLFVFLITLTFQNNEHPYIIFKYVCSIHCCINQFLLICLQLLFMFSLLLTKLQNQFICLEKTRQHNPEYQISKLCIQSQALESKNLDLICFCITIVHNSLTDIQ